MVKPEASTCTSNNSSGSGGSGEQLKYKGVRKRKWGKWVSEIRLPHSRERIWLGSYDSAEKAARAFDAAQFCLRGRSANFNFPDNPPDHIRTVSGTPAEIQAAASNFANNYVSPTAAAAATILEAEALSTAASSSTYQSPVTTVEVTNNGLNDDDDVVLFGNNNNDDDSTMGMRMGDVASLLDGRDGVGSFYYDHHQLGLTTMGSGNYAAEFGLADFYSTAQLPATSSSGVHAADHNNHDQDQDQDHFQFNYNYNYGYNYTYYEPDEEDNWANNYQDSYLWNF